MATGTVGSFIAGFQEAAWVYAAVLAAIWVIGAAIHQYPRILGILNEGSIAAWIVTQAVLSLLINSLIYGAGYMVGSVF